MRKDYEKIDYYNVGIEAIEVIEGLHLLFSCGNAFKYLYRSNNIRPKGEIISDLNKTIYYLKRMANRPRFNNSSNTEAYLKKLDSSMFSEPIYSAICNTLRGGTTSDMIMYKSYIEEAIVDIEAELSEY